MPDEQIDKDIRILVSGSSAAWFRHLEGVGEDKNGRSMWVNVFLTSILSFCLWNVVEGREILNPCGVVGCKASVWRDTYLVKVRVSFIFDFLSHTVGVCTFSHSVYIRSPHFGDRSTIFGKTLAVPTFCCHMTITPDIRCGAHSFDCFRVCCMCLYIGGPHTIELSV